MVLSERILPVPAACPCPSPDEAVGVHERSVDELAQRVVEVGAEGLAAPLHHVLQRLRRAQGAAGAEAGVVTRMGRGGIGARRQGAPFI